MSRTNRSGEGRISLDAYYTPDRLAEACLSTFSPAVSPKVVVEPSVGGGAYARAIRKRWPNVHLVGYDLNKTAQGAALCDDFYWTNWATVAPTQKCDMVLGNPPYSEAEEHVELALRRVKSGGMVGMLLRLSFASGKGRVPFWQKRTQDLYSVHVLAERPSFTGGTTDACDYGWFVWRPGVQNVPTFYPGWSWK